MVGYLFIRHGQTLNDVSVNTFRDYTLFMLGKVSETLVSETRRSLNGNATFTFIVDYCVCNHFGNEMSYTETVLFYACVVKGVLHNL